jgi:PAS domain S-box-containing protein
MEQVDRIFKARVVEANEAFARAYNSTLAEVIDRWRLEDFMPRSFPTSVPVLLETVRSRYQMKDVETTEQTTDGKTKIFVNSFVGTIQNQRVTRIWGMSRDVTETREIEKQIRLRQEAIESSGDGFVIADATLPDLPLIYVNRRFEELTGYTSDEVIGRNCRFLQGADSDEETTTRLRESLQAETRFQCEILNYRKDGSTFWNLLRIAPVRDKSGKMTHFIGLLTDVTERRLEDQASQQQRDQLAHFSRAATLVEIGAALAHELNQPLAAILRNAQAATRFLDRETPDLAQVREILADIVKDDRRAGDVLGRIRQHLRREDFQREPVDMNGVVRNSLEFLHSELIIAHIDIELQLAEELPFIMGDAVQLQQVILNLVLNAVEAVRLAEHADSRIVIETSSADHDTIRVSVSDSGRGIDESDLDRIFDPFHTTKEQGMGVGLSINRTIIESHDGRIWAENVPGGGASFVFTIPARSSGDTHGDH